MKVILLTQYFPPETGAPQNRLFATAQALREKGAEVTVLTAMPNYPDMHVQEGYRGRWKVEEEQGGMRVVRAWIHVPTGRGIFARLLNYFSFVVSSLIIGLFEMKRSDVLLVESPPLFLGITAMILARAKGAKLVFNVSDLWPESAVQLGLVTNRTMIRLSTWLEMKCYRSSALVTGQTQGIVDDIQRRCPQKRVVWIPNGVDFAAMEAFSQAAAGISLRAERGIRADELVFAYAGIIGHAQGLEVILRAAKLVREERVHFLLIGAGPELEKLKATAIVEQLRNVHFINKMSRAELIGVLLDVSGVVVPLRKNDLFKGAIPSKIFEALALGKPVLLGVEGEAKHLFIEDGGAGLAFMPEDAEDLARQVRTYCAEPGLLAIHGAQGLRYARTNFDRAEISGRLLTELQAITGRS